MNTLLANIENLKKVNSDNILKNSDNIPKNIQPHNTIEEIPVKEIVFTPLLPIDGFPEYLQNFISEYVNVYNIPRDYITASVIISTALAIGNKLELQGKYNNVPILWMAIIGNVSTGKTEPLKTCLKYFMKKDSEEKKQYKIDKNLYQTEQDKPKSERDNSIQKPQDFQYILKDYTPEILASLHTTNKRGLCIYRDELKGWLDDFGRYNKSGEQSNMLSSFFRDTIVINRVGGEPINIEDTCIFVCGGTQPDLLPTFANDNRAENGFLSRFIFAYPDIQEKQQYTKNKLNPETVSDYYKYLEVLTSIKEVVALKLSDEAENVYENWYNKNAKKTNDEPTGYLKGVYGKLDIISLRISIVVHGMKFACNKDISTEISESTMLTAINLTEYFRSTALKVYKKIFIDNSNLNKKNVIKYCHSLGASQNEIASVIKVSQQYVQKILK